MSLAIITPTRRRWHWLARQAAALAPQLRDDDRWVIVVDNDQPDERAIDRITPLVGAERVLWALLSYSRPHVPAGCVNRCHNIGVALAADDADVAEFDDHDLAEPHALDEIRLALANGYDYVFGAYRQQAVLVGPQGREYLETWPDVRHAYARGGFERGEIDAIGPRGIRRSLWNSLGGWDAKAWPCGDRDFAVRAERAGAAIVCLDLPLATVAIEPDSLSAVYRGQAPQEVLEK